MTQDTPPLDETVLGVIERTGSVTPAKLLEALSDLGYMHADSINAVQRVFGRRLIELADGGLLVLASEPVKVAA